RPVPAPDLAAVEAQLTAQLTRGAAHDVRLWWVCLGTQPPRGFAVSASAITASVPPLLALVGAAVAAHRLPADAKVLVSAVRLDAFHDETLAAVGTLPRDTFYPDPPI